MSVQHALIWAAAIFLVAFGARFGFVSDDAADFMLLMVTASAWLAIGPRRGRCSITEG